MADLIASLYPLQDRPELAQAAIEHRANGRRRVQMKSKAVQPRRRRARETTASQDEEESALSHEPGLGLQLTFSQRPKDDRGFVLGSKRSSCDVYLPDYLNNNGEPLISREHCRITFDEHRRLVVQGLSSRGTIVTYDNQGAEKRSRNFTWIIGGHDFCDNVDTIVIGILPNLKFRIVVAKHPLSPNLFLNNIDEFLKNAATSQDLPFGTLGIESTLSTANPSGKDTPIQLPIRLNLEKLGEGGFGVVTRVWDVSTGLEYASKRCRKPEACHWEREALVMRKTSHEHIVKLHDAVYGPPPQHLLEQLLLEYIPLGNLQDQHSVEILSDDEILTLLRQSTSALSYLHGQNPPIVHRDIKPENILVLSRKPFHIKLSDFGLAKVKDVSYLDSHCGTPMYAAPEIIQSTGPRRYTCAVDIWSLGVVVFQYSHRLLPYRQVSRPPWCDYIVMQLNIRYSGNLRGILLNMLVIDRKQRYSAQECMERALELERPQTTTPVPYDRQLCDIEEPKLTAIASAAAVYGPEASFHSVVPINTNKRKKAARPSATPSSSAGRAKRTAATSPRVHEQDDDSIFRQFVAYSD